jgi:3-oxoacyl-[acyl-carrier-protein] synthase II
VPALIATSVVRTCLGSGAETFGRLLRAEAGPQPLRHGDPAKLRVRYGYHIGTDDPRRPYRAGRWLAGCVREAARQAGLDPRRERVVALIGTGLRELSAVEDWALNGTPVAPHRLHFGSVVRGALPGLTEVITVSNACSASGHVLALAQHLVEADEADAVIVGGVDAMTLSMLAMIGRTTASPTDQVRPFDARRNGVLLGEAAAAVVVVPEHRYRHRPGAALGRLLATGLSCDAQHETAPDVDGICRAMRQAHERAGREPRDVDVVVAHGTGTALNDPAECAALRTVLVDGGADPAITAVKGAVGHTSGCAALVNLDVALRALRERVIPPVVGLRTVLDEGEGLRFVRDRPYAAAPRLVQVNAFGFGGVNAVTLLEAA